MQASCLVQEFEQWAGLMLAVYLNLHAKSEIRTAKARNTAYLLFYLLCTVQLNCFASVTRVLFICRPRLADEEGKEHRLRRVIDPKFR